MDADSDALHMQYRMYLEIHMNSWQHIDKILWGNLSEEIGKMLRQLTVYSTSELEQSRVIEYSNLCSKICHRQIAII